MDNQEEQLSASASSLKLPEARNSMEVTDDLSAPEIYPDVNVAGVDFHPELITGVKCKDVDQLFTEPKPLPRNPNRFRLQNELAHLLECESPSVTHKISDEAGIVIKL